MTPEAASALVRTVAARVGLPLVGFTPAGPVERHADYVRWLEQGYAADMDYLARDAAQRRDPRALLATARTVIVAALSHAHPDGEASGGRIPAARLTEGPLGRIARYARGGDYHTILKTRLYALGNELERELGRPLARLVCVDTAPLLERELGARAGLGFSAKSAMLIAPGHGSYLNLGALLVDLECAPGEPMESRCGSCTACMTACPTGAFVGPHVIDARRCVSYLTIENRGPIPRELRPLLGARIFGCDVCQEACPFNASGPTENAASTRRGDEALAPRPGYSTPPLLYLLGLGAAQFRKWQAKSSLRRIHRPELLRNVAVALGNVGGEESLDGLASALAERSPLVRQHVAWAIREIGRRTGSARAAAMLTAHRGHETDPEVLAELANDGPGS